MLGCRNQQLCCSEGYKKPACLLSAGYHGSLTVEHGMVIYLDLLILLKYWHHNTGFMYLQLNENFDPDDQHHIVRMLDFFPWKNHLCITFEMLGHNL